MDKSSTPGASYSKDNTQTQQKHQNSSRNYRSRPQVERELPYKDLRELLNHKRQNSEGNNAGPPSDPKYNYLSDPMRDGESSNGTSSTNTSNTTNFNNNFVGGRFSNQRFNFRNRGRGRSNIPPENSYQPKPGYNNEPSRFTRDWDQGKNDPRPRRYNNNPKPQYSEGPSSSDTSNFRYQENRNPRPVNPNYKGPPHKYNPNYRGGAQKRFPRRYPHPEPVNISVEYNVEDGFRKCTALDVKLDKNWKKRQETRVAPPLEVEAEENWDEEVAAAVDPEETTKGDEAKVETTKGDKPKVETELNEEVSKVAGDKSKADARKSPRVGGPRKQFSARKVDRSGATTKNEEISPGNADKDVGVTSKPNPESKDDGKTAPGIDQGSVEVDAGSLETDLVKPRDEGTKTSGVEVSPTKVEDGGATKTEVPSKDDGKSTLEVDEGPGKHDPVEPDDVETKTPKAEDDPTGVITATTTATTSAATTATETAASSATTSAATTATETAAAPATTSAAATATETAAATATETAAPPTTKPKEEEEATAAKEVEGDNVE